MFKFVRFIDQIDKEDVTLHDRSKYDVYDSGDWMVPVGDAVNSSAPRTSEWAEATEAAAVISGGLSANHIRMARIAWMEKGRTDAKAIGKFTTVRGERVRIKSDKFDNSQTYEPGMLLTIKAAAAGSNAGKVYLAPASGSDVVKAICYEVPAADAEGLLTFELVN